MNATEMNTQAKTTHLENLCATVIHPITGKFVTNYKKLSKYPATREVWTTEFGNEWGNLEQGDHKTGTKGKKSLSVLDHKEVKRIPSDCTVIYANIIVD